MERKDYTPQAEALFQRFAERHGLSYSVAPEAPIEALWAFPEQPRLSMPIMLGLQNGDELNFGVADFWSYFFPFETVAEEFDRAIDAWVSGDARVAVHRGRGRKLQVRNGDDWKTLYSANGGLSPILSKPVRFISNRPFS